MHLNVHGTVNTVGVYVRVTSHPHLSFPSGQRGVTIFLQNNEEAGVGKFGFLSQRDCYLAVCPWASHCPSLCLHSILPLKGPTL